MIRLPLQLGLRDERISHLNRTDNSADTLIDNSFASTAASAKSFFACVQNDQDVSPHHVPNGLPSPRARALPVHVSSIHETKQTGADFIGTASAYRVIV